MSDSENAKKLFFEALASIDSSDFPEAELRLREALRLAPGQAAVLTNLSVVLMHQDKRAEAREYAEKAIAISSNSIAALQVLADCHLQDESFIAGLAAYDRISALEPGIAEIHNNRGIILGRLGRHSDALDSYDRALSLNPDFSNAHTNRGTALHHLGRYDDALASHDRALALVPGLALAEAWLGRGNALAQLRRLDDALGAYEEALTRNPGLAEASLGLGNALCDLKRYDDALASYDRALAQAPSLAAAWLGRGNVFHESKRYVDALAAYDQALTLEPGLASAWIGRGGALRFLERTSESIAAYREALTLGGDVETIHYYLAALGAEPIPTATPEHFVASLFDTYADNFEKDLLENLKYQTPRLLADTIKRYAASNTLNILDMGCGTGLMGKLIRPIGRTLTGVDLSANMLKKAREHQIYDHLFHGSLTQFLQTQDKIFDLAVAADVFVYLGDLSPVFSGVRQVLSDGGLFCFSVEATDEGDFVLRSTLRYAHSIDYLSRLAEQHRFSVETIESKIIRQDAGANIDGYLAVMRSS